MENCNAPPRPTWRCSSRWHWSSREATAATDHAGELQLAEAWRTTITSPLETNLTAAERSFAQGDTGYLFVLENSRRFRIDARLRA